MGFGPIFMKNPFEIKYLLAPPLHIVERKRFPTRAASFSLTIVWWAR
jgi:hypothetical protein